MTRAIVASAASLACAMLAFGTAVGCDALFGPRLIEGRPCGPRGACPDRFQCASGVCIGTDAPSLDSVCAVACTDRSDCPDGDLCVHGACSLPPVSTCSDAEGCTQSLGRDGKCVNPFFCSPTCAADADCGSLPAHCDPRGYCQFRCLTDVDCSAGGGLTHCVDLGAASGFPELAGVNTCGCASDAECASVGGPGNDVCKPGGLCGCSSDAVCTEPGQTCVGT